MSYNIILNNRSLEFQMQLKHIEVSRFMYRIAYGVTGLTFLVALVLEIAFGQTYYVGPLALGLGILCAVLTPEPSPGKSGAALSLGFTAFLIMFGVVGLLGSGLLIHGDRVGKVFMHLSIAFAAFALAWESFSRFVNDKRRKSGTRSISL